MSDTQLPELPGGGPGAEARKWAMLCHYAAFAWFLAPMIGNVVGPLVVWQIKRDSDPYVDAQGKEALNFQITADPGAAGLRTLLLVLIGFPVDRPDQRGRAGADDDRRDQGQRGQALALSLLPAFAQVAATKKPTLRVGFFVWRAASDAQRPVVVDDQRRVLGEARLARQLGAAHEAAQCRG